MQLSLGDVYVPAAYGEESFLVRWWNFITGKVEPIPVTPKEQILKLPGTAATPTALMLSRTGYYSPEVSAAIKEAQLGTSGEYEAYLKNLAVGKAPEAAAPSEEVFAEAPSAELGWGTVLLIACGVIGMTLLVQRR